jgi:AcrR family transcriptional regulator
MSIRQQGREQRLQRIVDAARACFAEHGFAGTTIEAIALRAEVSNGLLYKHFASKEHLFQAVVSELVRGWASELVAAEAGGETALGKLEAMFRRSVAYCRTNPLLPAVLSGDKRFELARRENPDRGRVHAHRQLIANVLADGIAKGEFRADLEVSSVADLIQHIHTEYASRAYRNDPEFPYDDALVDAAVRFIHAAVKV